MFGPPQIKKERKKSCKIKIKSTPGGKEFSFSPECTKDQIEMAKQNTQEND